VIYYSGHGTLPHFGPQGEYTHFVMNARFFFNDTATTEICTRARSTHAHAQGFAARTPGALLLVGAYRSRTDGRGLGTSLQRHPFSGLAHSVGGLLHDP